MLIGMQELDVDEWEANTNYRNYNRNSKQINWFWQVYYTTELVSNSHIHNMVYWKLLNIHKHTDEVGFSS